MAVIKLGSKILISFTDSKEGVVIALIILSLGVSLALAFIGLTRHADVQIRSQDVIQAAKYVM